ncbi:O-antigen polymerase [Tenacibaculum sp. 190524A05c]|uniref:Oligosaccharide repeat unit polymerase n=1 Tax=Tenacibaculum platacis TaxID=3137852 RepID=A0ABM9P4E2_9FLAO
MILFCFIWLFIVFFTVLIKDKQKDLFSPGKFVAIKNIIFNLPFILFIYFNPEMFPEEILRVCQVDLEDAFLWYTFVKTLSFISLILGINFYSRKREKVKHNVIRNSYFSIKLTSLIFLGIGIGAYIIFLSSAGGITNLLLNLSSRVELQSGQKVLFFLPFLNLSVLFYMLVVKMKRTNRNVLFLVLIVIISFLIYSSLGGRKNSLYLLIMLVVGYNYIIKPIKVREISKIKILTAVSFVAFYILIIPLIRRPNGLEELFSSSTDLVEIFQIRDLVYSISYTYIDVFAANYFHLDNLWFFNGVGDIFLNAFSSVDSKSYLPPIDDGVYFRSIVSYNRYFSPPTPRGLLTNSSWPIENFGFSYANFSLFGVVLFFFLQGVVFAYFYKLITKNKFKVIFVFLYVFVIFNFNFSNLRIVQFILTIPIILLAYLIFRVFDLKKQFK